MSFTFGSKDLFALVVGEPSWPNRAVEVWIGGVNLSSFDSSAYLPSFIHSMTTMRNKLRDQLNFLTHESDLGGTGVEGAFLRLASQELPQAWSDLRVLDFGPTTDDFLCFLVPVHGRLYLGCKGYTADGVVAVRITPFDLISALNTALLELSKYAPRT